MSDTMGNMVAAAAGVPSDPGIYFDVSWSDYLKIPYPSNGLLKQGMRSMYRLHRVMTGEHEVVSQKTAAVGQILHSLIAGDFDERFAVLPPFENDPANKTTTGRRSTSKSTKYYSEMLEAWRSMLRDKEEVTEVQKNTALVALGRIKDCHEATDLISRSRSEVTVIADIAGVRTKTRLDGVSAARDIWDLKTSDDISEKPFYRTFRKIGYRFQFTFHQLAIKNAPGGWVPKGNYKVIAAEVKDDYEVAVIDVPLVWLESFEERVRSVIKQYKAALASGVWPGLYPLGTGDLAIPNYDMDDELDWADEAPPEDTPDGQH